MVGGFPAKRVADMEKLRRHMTAKRVDAATWQMLKHFVGVVLRREMGIDVRDDTDNELSFHCRGRQYVTLCIPANELVPSTIDLASDKRLIFLVNRCQWEPPLTLRNPVVFDLTTMRTYFSHDKIHAKLWNFMRRYYGVTFEYE